MLVGWLPVLVWAAVIWQLGGDDWSQDETSRILGPFFEWLLPDLDPMRRAALVQAVRKLAHPGVYGVLALLALHAVERSARWPAWASALAALTPSVLLAIADESRQASSSARTGSAVDVALDVAGGVAVIGMALALERILGRRLFGGDRSEGA